MLGRTKKEVINDEKKKVIDRDEGEKGMDVRSEDVDTEYVGDSREKDRYERTIIISKWEKGEKEIGVDGDIMIQDGYKRTVLGDKTDEDNREGCVEEKGKEDDNDKEEDVNKNKRFKHGTQMSSSEKKRNKGVHQRKKVEERVADGYARNNNIRNNEYEGDTNPDSVDWKKEDRGAEKESSKNRDNSSQHNIPNENIIEDDAQDERDRSMTPIDIYNRNGDEDQTKHVEMKRRCVERRYDIQGAGALSLPVKVPVTSLHFRPKDKTTYLLGTESGEVLLVGGLRGEFLFNNLEGYRLFHSLQKSRGQFNTRKDLFHGAVKTN